MDGLYKCDQYCLRSIINVLGSKKMKVKVQGYVLEHFVCIILFKYIINIYGHQCQPSILCISWDWLWIYNIVTIKVVCIHIFNQPIQQHTKFWKILTDIYYIYIIYIYYSLLLLDILSFSLLLGSKLSLSSSVSHQSTLTFTNPWID